MPQGWLEVSGGGSHPRREEEESQDPLLEEKIAHEAMRTEQKGHGEENLPIHKVFKTPKLLNCAQ